jgi:hypothetical protein
MANTDINFDNHFSYTSKKIEESFNLDTYFCTWNIETIKISAVAAQRNSCAVLYFIIIIKFIHILGYGNQIVNVLHVQRGPSRERKFQPAP